MGIVETELVPNVHETKSTLVGMHLNDASDDRSSGEPGDGINGAAVVAITFVPKQARALEPPRVLDADVLAWKKNFWRERIRTIKHVVAPMVDQSELAFRMFLRQRGAADLCFTPMIHSNLFVSDVTYRRKAFTTLRLISTQFETDSVTHSHLTDRPLIVQFCANDPRVFLDACCLVEGYCEGVDLNLGCPQLIAKRGHYGSFLQEYPDLVMEMVRTVHAHCRLPLSVKIRALESVDATVDYARKLVDAGAAMITVHGRTREQRGVLTGLADWRHIAAVKRAVDVPVIANGNIQLFGDVARCLHATSADAVMSAEGILSNPLLFAGRNLCAFDVARDYLKYAARYKANISAIRAHIFRICHHSLLKHNDLREKTSYVFSIGEFRKIVDELERRCLADDELHKDIEMGVNTAEMANVSKGDVDYTGANLPSTRISEHCLAVNQEKAIAAGHLSSVASQTQRRLVLDHASQKLLLAAESAFDEGINTSTTGNDSVEHDGDGDEDDKNLMNGFGDESYLLDLVNKMPYWVCKPYVRQSRAQSTPSNSDGAKATQNATGSVQTSGDSNTVAATGTQFTSAYRAARRVEMERLVAETGLSKRQLRKRERRRVEAKRKEHSVALLNDEQDGDEKGDGTIAFNLIAFEASKKRRYAPCERCALPAGVNCDQLFCKRCCKLTCVRTARDCKVHGFIHKRMYEKRLNYAQRMGITVEDLLRKEMQNSERQKFLKNTKKAPLDLSTLQNSRRDEVGDSSASDGRVNGTAMEGDVVNHAILNDGVPSAASRK